MLECGELSACVFIGVINLIYFRNYGEVLNLMQVTSNSSSTLNERFLITEVTIQRFEDSKETNPEKVERMDNTSENFMERNLYDPDIAPKKYHFGIWAETRGGANLSANNDQLQGKRADSISSSKRDSMMSNVNILSARGNTRNSKESSFEGREAQAGFMAVSTASSSADMDSLQATILEIYKKSGPVKIIIFDLGLSEVDKKIIVDYYSFCEIRSTPVDTVTCASTARFCPFVAA